VRVFVGTVFSVLPLYHAQRAKRSAIEIFYLRVTPLDQRFPAPIDPDQDDLVGHGVKTPVPDDTGPGLSQVKVISERPPVALHIVDSLASNT
jgi:hypothetical protein